jgi:hypothetical protein
MFVYMIYMFYVCREQNDKSAGKQQFNHKTGRFLRIYV